MSVVRRRFRSIAAPIVSVVLALGIFMGITTLAHAATVDPSATATTTDTATVTTTDTATVTTTDTATVTPTDTATVTPTDTATVTPTDTATVTPTDTASPTPTDTSSPTPTPITTWWGVRQRNLWNGRTYYVVRPFCAPLSEQACTDFLQTPRPLTIYAHPANWAEDATTAGTVLSWLRNIDQSTIYAFAVSAGGTKVFDAGVCCTTSPVDEIGYLRMIVNDTANMVGIDRARVGMLGISNGGMLAERAACVRPDVFAAAASLSGPWAGACNVGLSTVRQWHGATDAVVPLNGGTTWVAGASRTFPPSASLAQRMATGSQFQLDVLPGLGHYLPTSVLVEAGQWLSATLAAR